MLAKELQLILASSSLHTSEEALQAIDALIPEVKDWEAFTHLLINNTTAPLLYSKLKQCNNAQLIPAASLALLRKVYYTTFFFRIKNKEQRLKTGRRGLMVNV
ncbi:hypothetical protein JZU68_01790 [bacterium]|jgi:hypothetical protein|nr:hypothetical protein [bacterium]